MHVICACVCTEGACHNPYYYTFTSHNSAVVLFVANYFECGEAANAAHNADNGVKETSFEGDSASCTISPFLFSLDKKAAS